MKGQQLRRLKSLWNPDCFATLWSFDSPYNASPAHHIPLRHHFVCMLHFFSTFLKAQQLLLKSFKTSKFKEAANQRTHCWFSPQLGSQKWHLQYQRNQRCIFGLQDFQFNLAICSKEWSGVETLPGAQLLTVEHSLLVGHLPVAPAPDHRPARRLRLSAASGLLWSESTVLWALALPKAHTWYLSRTLRTPCV